MFTAFFRSKNKITQDLNSNGHGLGLNICKKIAKLLGGGLDVQSVLGEGSTFILSLESKYDHLIQT